MHQGDKPIPEDLRRGPLLQPLTDAQLARCASRALRLRLDDGEDLFRHGMTQVKAKARPRQTMALQPTRANSPCQMPSRPISPTTTAPATSV